MKIKNAQKILGNNNLNFKINIGSSLKFLTLTLIINSIFLLANAESKMKNSNIKSAEESQLMKENNKPTLNIITELTSSTIHNFFDNSDLMLILFIEPNCLKCNRFIKVLIELNEKLSKENSDLKKIKLATVNGFLEKQIVEKLNVEEIPSFLFINKKLNQEEIISDLQSMDELFEFLKKKIIRKWNFLENLQQLSDFREKRINMIVCRNEQSEIHEEFFSKLKLIIAKYEHVNYYVLNLIKHKSDIKKLEKEYQEYLKAQDQKETQTQSKNRTSDKTKPKNKEKIKSEEKTEAIEPVAKFLKEEKIEILNSLNCTNDAHFVIHVFKNFDLNHVYISIPKWEEFNYTKIEDWVSAAVEFSIQKMTLNSIKEIYNTEKPALIYIDKPFNRKKTYLTDQIEDDYEQSENEVFKALQVKSYLERKNFLFLMAQENDFSTQLVMDLFDIRRTFKAPIIVGLRYNRDHKNFIKKVFTKIDNDTINLNHTEKSINKFIKLHKRNLLTEEDFQYDQRFIGEEYKEEQMRNPVYKSNAGDESKYEIYLIDRSNYKKTIVDREGEIIYVLLTYKRKLEAEFLVFLKKLSRYLIKNNAINIRVGAVDIQSYREINTPYVFLVYPSKLSRKRNSDSDMFLEDYNIYSNNWSVEKIVNFLYHLKIQVGDKKYEELIFDDADKEILKLERTLTGLKLVSNNGEIENYRFNVFNKQIQIHNNLVNEIFKSNPESKVDNSNTNLVSNEKKNQNENKDTVNNPNSSTAEGTELDDSLKKSDF